MALKLEDKKVIVEEVASVAAEAVSAVTAYYRCLSVADMTKLRALARNSGVYLRVVRNTLARRAVENTEFACLKEALVGPVVLAFSKTEPSAAARLFRDFAKEHEQFKVQALAIGGKLLAADQLTVVASLPTYDEAIAKLMSVMQAPISKLVRTIAAPQEKLVRTLAAVRDQKQAA